MLFRQAPSISVSASVAAGAAAAVDANLVVQRITIN